MTFDASRRAEGNLDWRVEEVHRSCIVLRTAERMSFESAAKSFNDSCWRGLVDGYEGIESKACSFSSAERSMTVDWIMVAGRGVFCFPFSFVSLL